MQKSHLAATLSSNLLCDINVTMAIIAWPVSVQSLSPGHFSLWSLRFLGMASM